MGHYSFIENIVNVGATIDAPLSRQHGITALYIAVKKKDAKCVKLLIDASANINPPWTMKLGLTALSAASTKMTCKWLSIFLGLVQIPTNGH